jgi:hypothetical protein
MLKLTNTVVRDVRDREGCKLGSVIEPHDGTEGGVIAAARVATDRMYAEYADASNIESRICATDGCGRPKWAVSPNFLHLAEIGTEEAAYIWGLTPESKTVIPVCRTLIGSQTFTQLKVRYKEFKSSSLMRN